MKKSDKTVAVSSFYQWAFLVAVALGWLVQVGFVLYEAISNHGYHVAEIWLFQLSSWGIPLYYFALSLAFYRKRYVKQKLLFMSAFLATVGTLLYDGFTNIAQGIFGLYISQHGLDLNGNSFWSGTGFISIMLTVGVLAFPAGLYCIRKRKDI